eukprot:3356641-Prymnesium_polylepis.1
MASLALAAPRMVWPLAPHYMIVASSPRHPHPDACAHCAAGPADLAADLPDERRLRRRRGARGEARGGGGASGVGARAPDDRFARKRARAVAAWPHLARAAHPELVGRRRPRARPHSAQLRRAVQDRRVPAQRPQ